MKALIRKLYFLFFILFCSYSYGQMKEYQYKRELTGITEQWHKVVLPSEFFEKVGQNLHDIRIFGLTEDNDTIEAAYLLRPSKEKISNKEIAFKTLNISKNSKGYYFTFEIPTKESINHIHLDFKQENFDWRITLEGSHNQREWYTVVEDYRILSINKDQTNFQFTTLTFPNAKYRFFRVFVKSKVKPELSRANIKKQDSTDGIYKQYSVKKLRRKENKQTKQTEIDIEFQSPVRICNINIDASDTFDYYRYVTIQALTDSVKTEKGWKYNFTTLTSGTMASVEKNEFQFSSRTVQKLKIYIDNQDNQPLMIDKIYAKGYIYELITRFTDQSTYYLTYGNKNSKRPNYDIARFSDNIPQTTSALTIGDEFIIEKNEDKTTDPLFKNKTWLWTIMLLIIVLLGWFSIKMMKKN